MILDQVYELLHVNVVCMQESNRRIRVAFCIKLGEWNKIEGNHEKKVTRWAK